MITQRPVSRSDHQPWQKTQCWNIHQRSMEYLLGSLATTPPARTRLGKRLLSLCNMAIHQFEAARCKNLMPRNAAILPGVVQSCCQRPDNVGQQHCQAWDKLNTGPDRQHVARLLRSDNPFGLRLPERGCVNLNGRCRCVGPEYRRSADGCGGLRRCWCRPSWGSPGGVEKAPCWVASGGTVQVRRFERTSRKRR